MERQRVGNTKSVVTAILLCSVLGVAGLVVPIVGTAVGIILGIVISICIGASSQSRLRKHGHVR